MRFLAHGEALVNFLVPEGTSEPLLRSKGTSDPTISTHSF